MRSSFLGAGLGAMLGALTLAAAAPPALAQATSDTVAAIRARGFLQCGVSPSTVGFSLPDSRG